MDRELTPQQKFEKYVRENMSMLFKELTEVREVIYKIAQQFDREIADLKDSKKSTKVNAKAIEKLKGFK